MRMAKPEIPPVTFFCLCGAAFHSVEILKAHQVEFRHSPTVSYELPRQYAPADPLSPAAMDDIRDGLPTYDVDSVPCCDNWPSGSVDDDNFVLLDPTDPFDAAVAEIVKMNRKKRADYSLDGADVFTNFRQTSEALAVDGFGPTDAALFNVIQKIMRLRSLRSNGRMDDPANEATADTYLDLAVYAIIALALSREV
jgi:hypothetical protein